MVASLGPRLPACDEEIQMQAYSLDPQVGTTRGWGEEAGVVVPSYPPALCGGEVSWVLSKRTSSLLGRQAPTQYG